MNVTLPGFLTKYSLKSQSAFPSNCLAGGLDAALALPVVAQIKDQDLLVRGVICVVYMFLVAILLFVDHHTESHLMGYFFGSVMVVMILLFGLIAGLLVRNR